MSTLRLKSWNKTLAIAVAGIALVAIQPEAFAQAPADVRQVAVPVASGSWPHVSLFGDAC